MPLKERLEKRQEEKLKSSEMRPRHRAGSLLPDRLTLALLLKVWGRWAAAWRLIHILEQHMSGVALRPAGVEAVGLGR